MTNHFSVIFKIFYISKNYGKNLFFISNIIFFIFSSAGLAQDISSHHRDHRSGIKLAHYINQGPLLFHHDKKTLDQFLKDNAEIYEIENILEDLVFSSKKKGLAYTYYYYSQFLNEIPVLHGEIIISVENHSGLVAKVFNNTYSSSVAKATAQLPSEAKLSTGMP